VRASSSVCVCVCECVCARARAIGYSRWAYGAGRSAPPPMRLGPAPARSRLLESPGREAGPGGGPFSRPFERGVGGPGVIPSTLCLDFSCAPKLLTHARAHTHTYTYTHTHHQQQTQSMHASPIPPTKSPRSNKTSQVSPTLPLHPCQHQMGTPPPPG
jgi:hypothetical protein